MEKVVDAPLAAVVNALPCKHYNLLGLSIILFIITIVLYNRLLVVNKQNRCILREMDNMVLQMQELSQSTTTNSQPAQTQGYTSRTNTQYHTQPQNMVYTQPVIVTQPHKSMCILL
jgi:hypothetical protein